LSASPIPTAVGVGYSYTIGTGGPAIVELLARSLAPALLGRDGAQVERSGAISLFLTHATSVGAITSLALAAIDTALWDLRCRKAGLPLHVMAGGAKDRILCTPRKAAGCICRKRRWVDDALKAKSLGFGGSKVKVGRPIHEDVERLEALRGALGADFEILTTPTRHSTSTRRSAAPPLRGRRHRLVRRASASRRHRGTREALAVDVDPHRNWREPLRAFPTFATICNAGPAPSSK